MHIVIFLFLTFVLQACMNSEVEDLVHKLKTETLISLIYELRGDKYECNIREAKSTLLKWSKTFHEPPMGSWADADEFLVLQFEGSSKLRLRVTLSSASLGYSTIRGGKLYVGEPLNIASLCST